MPALLPFDPQPTQPACAELDDWHRRLAWKDRHGRAWTGRLRRDVEAEAVAASTRMEGVPVTVEEVRRILAGDRPPEVSAADARLVEGYRNAMRFALSRADDPAFRWSSELIVGLHDRVLGGDVALGAGRFADRPRWVAVTGAEGALFEPPAADDVPPLVDEMCDVMNAGGPHPAVAAAWVHIATAAIHPFRDGNGRAARVLASLAMYRGGFRLWAFTTLESWWGHHRDDYYDTFRCLGGHFDREADVTPFVVAHVQAQLSQVRALDLRDRVEHHVWDAIVTAVEDVGLEERVANAVWEAFFERDVTAGYYRGLTEVSPATATHDLRAAVAAGLLSARGERRGRRYLPGPRLHSAVGALLGIQAAPDREAIVRIVARRIAEDAPAHGGGQASERSMQRQVDVRHLQGDAALDYDIAVRDGGELLGRIRASLSPEAWVRLGRMLGHTRWRLPSGDLTGDAATVAQAFIDVIADIIASRPPRLPDELRVGSADTDLLERVAERSRKALSRPSETGGGAHPLGR